MQHIQKKLFIHVELENILSPSKIESTFDLDCLKIHPRNITRCNEQWPLDFRIFSARRITLVPNKAAINKDEVRNRSSNSFNQIRNIKVARRTKATGARAIGENKEQTTSETLGIPRG